MKNLLILCSFIIVVIWWALKMIMASYINVSEKENNLTAIDIHTESPLDVEALSRNLGVEFKRIDDKKLDVPLYQDAQLSLIAVYTSGELAVARVKVTLSDSDEYLNIKKGDSFYQYRITEIDVNSITLSLKDTQPIELKIFKPLTVSVMASEANGEV
ncbi:hypothetical protein [Pseudoalteromonas sp. OF7H-1]|uniref:hypothetical protein n=2 Tax=Pseudoalteromonas TaxID=53246 RepID=UPI001023D3B5|nr:hypothetical protein [Pseudoalteromonas sp. OF7H-1]